MLYAARIFILLCTSLIFASAHAVDSATLTVIGDMDSFVIGQDGFCGDRTQVDEAGLQKIILRGDEQVWLMAKSRFYLGNLKRGPRTSVCQRERAFIPKAGTAYILRLTHMPGDCQIELFRAVRDADPVREKMIIPTSQSCLLK